MESSKRTPALLAVGMGFFLLSCFSCATQSRLVSSWELPSHEVGPFHKIVVFALMRNKEQSKAMEMGAVEQLKKAGVDAIPGFTVINEEKGITLSEMEKGVQSTGADAVMVYKEIAVDRNLQYVPPTAYAVPDGPYDDWWDDPFWGYYAPYPYGYWGYWYPGYQVVASPGYWSQSDTYRVETVLYRTSDDRLVWSAVSETYNPNNQADLGRSLTRRVVQRLERQKIITS
jgi:hypothetical protein